MSTTIVQSDVTIIATPARWLITYDPATRDFIVLRNEKVIDHVRSYLEGEQLKNDFEAHLARMEGSHGHT